MTEGRALALALALLAVVAAPVMAQQPAAPDTAIISWASARAAALAEVPHNRGLRSGRLEKRDGALVYDFEIDTPGPGHQEVRVDGQTGAILVDRHEDDLVGSATAKVSSAARSTGRAAREAGATVTEGAKEAGATVTEGAKEAGATVSEGAKEAGATVAKDAKEAGATVARGARDAGSAVSGDARRAGKAVSGAARGAAARVRALVRPENMKEATPAVPEERAREIARAAVPDAPVTAAELAREDGVLVWRIDLNPPGKGYEEVTLDATTGQVIAEERRP